MGIAEASRASAVWARISPKVSPMPGPSTCGIVRSTIQTVVCRTPTATPLGITHRWFGGKPPAWAAVFKVHCSCANTARKETKGGYFRETCWHPRVQGKSAVAADENLWSGEVFVQYKHRMCLSSYRAVLVIARRIFHTCILKSVRGPHGPLMCSNRLVH